MLTRPCRMSTERAVAMAAMMAARSRPRQYTVLQHKIHILEFFKSRKN